MESELNRSVIRPDIFIVGVMKGGTTILHDYICVHPEIESGSQKEIHYFSLNFDKGSDWYDRHFQEVSIGCRTIDASPTYFDSVNTPLIPKLIRSYALDPRAIIIFRDPIARAISQYVHLVKIAKVKALADMCADEFFHQNFHDAYRQSGELGFFLNQVLQFSLYSRKFMSYKNVFENHQLLTLHNDELRKNPREVMSRVFEFINVEYVEDQMFGVVKRSNGSGLSLISQETYDKLADFLYTDYKQFCALSGIEFNTVDFKAAA